MKNNIKYYSELFQNDSKYQNMKYMSRQCGCYSYNSGYIQTEIAEDSRNDVVITVHGAPLSLSIGNLIISVYVKRVFNFYYLLARGIKLKSPHA